LGGLANNYYMASALGLRYLGNGVAGRIWIFDKL